MTDRLDATRQRRVRITILACMLIITSCSWQALVPTRDPAPTTAAPVQRPKASPTPYSVPPSPTPLSPVPTSAPAQNKLGTHLLLDDGRTIWPVDVWPEHLAYARRAVGEWGYVTELIRESGLDAARWQHFMNICKELHLTPILRLATTYDVRDGWWNAPDPDPDGSYASIAGRYAAFVTALEWPTGAHYVLVGNEPNHGNEWGGRPDPAAYGRFLVAVADAVHAADPGAKVLNAGLDPYTPNTNGVPFVDGLVYVDEETFLDEMVRAVPDVFSHLDLWASHAYPTGPLTDGPWQQTFRIDADQRGRQSRPRRRRRREPTTGASTATRGSSSSCRPTAWPRCR